METALVIVPPDPKPAPESLKVELRNVKHLDSMSHDTYCFSADVWVNGVKAGQASNEGYGGPTMIHPISLHHRIDAWAATLPPLECEWEDPRKPGHKMTLTQDAELVIGELLTAHLREKKTRAKLAKAVYFTRAGSDDVWALKGEKAAALKTRLADPGLAGRLQADRILNLLPIEQAVQLMCRSK